MSLIKFILSTIGSKEGNDFPIKYAKTQYKRGKLLFKNIGDKKWITITPKEMKIDNNEYGIDL